MAPKLPKPPTTLLVAIGLLSIWLVAMPVDAECTTQSQLLDPVCQIRQELTQVVCGSNGSTTWRFPDGSYRCYQCNYTCLTGEMVTSCPSTSFPADCTAAGAVNLGNGACCIVYNITLVNGTTPITPAQVCPYAGSGQCSATSQPIITTCPPLNAGARSVLPSKTLSTLPKPSARSALLPGKTASAPITTATATTKKQGTSTTVYEWTQPDSTNPASVNATTTNPVCYVCGACLPPSPSATADRLSFGIGTVIFMVALAILSEF